MCRREPKPRTVIHNVDAGPENPDGNRDVHGQPVVPATQAVSANVEIRQHHSTKRARRDVSDSPRRPKRHTRPCWM